MLEFAAEGAQPVAEEIRGQLVEPFITATGAALGEMAGTEVQVRGVHQTRLDHPLGDLAAVVEMQSTNSGCLVLGFPARTAAALARRILAAVTDQVVEDLIRDCVGEIANVIAGQAKALLAGTPYQFVFSMPRVVADAHAFRLPPHADWLVVVFSSDQGEFAVQLLRK
jgi:chemotaxis protein CheX